MSKYRGQLKIRLTDEQRKIVALHPHAPTKIRNFIRNLNGRVDARKRNNYSINLTDECWEKLEGVKNKSELIRQYIDNTLKHEI